MRPIKRGQSHRYVRRTYAKAWLVERLGDYCSYCERPTSSAVEHVLPWGPKKSDTNPPQQSVAQHTRLEHSWNNFLLTCVKCNNFKKERQNPHPYGATRAARRRYYWPDTDNTFRAYEYHPTGDVVAHPALTKHEKSKADSTLHMFGFDSCYDPRKSKRSEVWSCAALHLVSWLASPTDGNLELIASSAKNAGNWSVWVTVFAAQPVVLARLNAVFPGTDRRCFDSRTGIAVPRPKGQL